MMTCQFFIVIIYNEELRLLEGIENVDMDQDKKHS